MMEFPSYVTNGDKPRLINMVRCKPRYFGSTACPCEKLSSRRKMAGRHVRVVIAAASTSSSREMEAMQAGLSRRGDKQKAPKKAPGEEPEVLLPRSVLMDKEIITRTSGKRLGYVNQLFVDPVRLEVVTLYLRQSISALGAANSEHVSLSSLRQIGDVVLVHDESALWDPPGDETLGYVRLVGSEVQTEDGVVLGKVRDFLFNPDNGEIASIRYDALGLPSIPQNLLSCSRLDWRDIVAVGPTKTIVRRGAERRAIKENEGWISEYVTSLVSLVAGLDLEDAVEDSEEGYRADPAYASWYEQHAADYERYYNQKLPKPIGPKSRRKNTARQEQQLNRERRPLALPPPQRPSIQSSFERTVQRQRVPERQQERSMSAYPKQQRRNRSDYSRQPRDGSGPTGQERKSSSVERQRRYMDSIQFEKSSIPSDRVAN